MVRPSARAKVADFTAFCPNPNPSPNPNPNPNPDPDPDPDPNPDPNPYTLTRCCTPCLAWMRSRPTSMLTRGRATSSRRAPRPPHFTSHPLASHATVHALAPASPECATSSRRAHSHAPSHTPSHTPYYTPLTHPSHTLTHPSHTPLHLPHPWAARRRADGERHVRADGPARTRARRRPQQTLRHLRLRIRALLPLTPEQSTAGRAALCLCVCLGRALTIVRYVLPLYVVRPRRARARGRVEKPLTHLCRKRAENNYKEYHYQFQAFSFLG